MTLPEFSRVLRTRSVRTIVAIACGTLVAVPFGRAADRGSHSDWVATWGTAMAASDHGEAADLTDQTLREIVHTSVGGRRVRVWLSNRFGTEPLHIGAAHIALCVCGNTAVNADGSGNQSAIQPGSDRTLTFHQMASFTIAPGASIVSDPVALNVPALSNVAVSLYFPKHTIASTEHFTAYQISYRVTGNETDAATLAGKSWPVTSWYVLQGMDVAAPGDSAVVAVGDSITDGDNSTVNANHRWPNYLAMRLAASPTARRAGLLGVVDAGIDGNRVLLNGYGPNAVARVDWDVLGRSGVRALIVLESVNDIGRFETDHQPYADLAERLEAGLAQLAAQAHQHGIRVLAGTLTPYQESAYYSAAGEQVRQAVNRWIRTTHMVDGVVEFDKAVRDPGNPLHYAPKYDSGDHLHPNDAGYKAMAGAIDLSLLTKKK